MPEENLGSGVALDQYWDFSVGPTGDLETEEGRDELEKDLAVVMAINLEEFVGEPPDAQTRAAIKQEVKGNALADPRIVSVDEDSLSVKITDRDEISVSVTVTTNTDQEYELVFDV